MGSDLAPRERLLRHGAQGLSDAELLAVVLRTGSPGIQAQRTAERLLGAAGGLDGLFAADRQALRSFGVSSSRASILLATTELLRRLTRQRAEKRPRLVESGEVAEYLLLRLPSNGQEILGALYLDVRDRLIAEEEVFRGTLGRLAVEPGPILYRAILHRAASFILWHSHPSGDPQPSEDDLAFTRRMFDAGQVVNIPMVDHLILAANGRWVSLCRRGVCGFLNCA